MKEKKVYAILDTETTRGQQNVYNVGYIIINQKGYELHRREMFLIDNLENDEPFYDDKMERQAEKMLTETAIFQIMKDFTKYGVTTICAYNATFDIRVLAKTGLKLDEHFEIIDLWSRAVDLICNSKKYVKFAEKNGYLTEKGNIKSSAESVYAFISEIENFSEAHTALADCEIEKEIFRNLQRRAKKIHEMENYSQPFWHFVKLLDGLQ